MSEFVARSSVGPIPGEAVILAGAVFYLGITLTTILTAGLHQASGEVLPKYDVFAGGEKATNFEAIRPAFKRRKQLLVWMVTDKPEEISHAVMEAMHRGVTAVAGTGMYTGKKHSILMVAVTVTEIAELKKIVMTVDPQAFIVVNPAQAVFGSGFQKLDIKT